MHGSWLGRSPLGRWGAARAEADELLPPDAFGTLPEVLQPLGRLVRGIIDGAGAKGLSGEAGPYQLARAGREDEARALYYHATIAADNSAATAARVALKVRAAPAANAEPSHQQ